MVKHETLIEELKTKKPLTREDIANLLATIGKPGKNLVEKEAAVTALGKFNFQGISVQESLKDYSEY